MDASRTWVANFSEPVLLKAGKRYDLRTKYDDDGNPEWTEVVDPETGEVVTRTEDWVPEGGA